MKKSTIVKMGYLIQQFLVEKKLVDVKPKELMPILIEKGFFKQDHQSGLPLRNVLRQLDEENMLYLLPQVRAERKDINRLWFFNPIYV